MTRSQFSKIMSFLFGAYVLLIRTEHPNMFTYLSGSACLLLAGYWTYRVFHPTPNDTTHVTNPQGDEVVFKKDDVAFFITSFIKAPIILLAFFGLTYAVMMMVAHFIVSFTK